MAPTLLFQTAVVTANLFNPSLITHPWLIESGFLRADEQLATGIFTRDMAQVQAPGVSLLVVPPSLQVQVQAGLSLQSVLESRLIPVLKQIPHTPLTALGINYSYELRLADQTAALTRSWFVGQNKLFQHFSAADARFGTYASTNVSSGRLKLDIKPIAANDKGEGIALTFNFHRDLSNTARLADLEQHVSESDEFQKLTQTLLQCLSDDHG